MNDRGEVTERLKVLASKASVRETVPWVRIPPSPPELPWSRLHRDFGCGLRRPQSASSSNPTLFAIFLPRLRIQCSFREAAHPNKVAVVCSGISSHNEGSLPLTGNPAANNSHLVWMR